MVQRSSSFQSARSATAIQRERGFNARVALDSSALWISSIALLVTGAMRTKFAAVTLGVKGLGAVSQLSQLSASVVFVCALGFSTGARLALSRGTLTDEDRARAGKGLLAPIAAFSLLATALAMPMSGLLANALLGSRSLAGELRIAIMVVPIDTVIGILIAISQAWTEFRQIAVASLLTAGIGSAATVPLLVSGRLTFAVLTIPVAAAVQLASLVWASPAIRRTLKAPWGMTTGLIREVLQVGALSFVLGGADTLAEMIVRVIMVHIGGLSLVAGYQPIYLLSSSGFELLLGAISAALLVHITRVADSSPSAELNSSLNSVLLRAMVVVGVAGFAVQTFGHIYIPLMFSSDLLRVTPALSYQAPVEILRCTVWILGAALLPLSLRRHWLCAGIAVVVVETIVVMATVRTMGLYAAPLGSAAGWLVGLLVTVHGLRRRGITPSGATIALALWTIGLEVVGALSVRAGATYELCLLPLGLAAVWILPIVVTRSSTPRVLALRH